MAALLVPQNNWIGIGTGTTYTPSSMLIAQIGVFMFGAGAAYVLFYKESGRSIADQPSQEPLPSNPDPHSTQRPKIENGEKIDRPVEEAEIAESSVEPPATGETLPEEDKKIGLVLRLLIGDERTVFRSIVDAGGETYQKDIVIGTKLSDAKVSRILDRLEEKELVEKERRGMTNLIRVKIE